MNFPLAVLDFEASSLSLSTYPELSSYPIEVGLAVATGLSEPILVWSSLIKPDPEWAARGDWDRASEKVHGIAREKLIAGMPPPQVAAALDEVLEPLGHAWCDGGRYDGHWLTVLYGAAKTKPKFHLGDMAGLFAFDRPMQNRYADILAATAPPHRAGEDAARICSALVSAAGGSPPLFRTSADRILGRLEGE
ncbi:MAG: hypothetical protein M3Q08_02165 [Pseudomonadota bacterium]|nr:hypothetical protein [Pseudomonadota bacterium]